jgi:hypothetical protein
VAHYKFDGNADDSSGNGNNGSLNGGPTFVAGKVGQAISLNGTTGFVRVNDSNSLDFNNADFSVMGWVKRANTSGAGGSIFMKKLDTGVSDNFANYIFGVGAWASCQANRILVSMGNGTGRSFDCSLTATISDTAWHHVAAVFSTSNNRVQFYIDGALSSTASNVTINPSPNAGPLIIGKHVNASGASGFFWNGLLDDLRIYSKALSASEVSAIFDGGGVIVSKFAPGERIELTTNDVNVRSAPSPTAASLGQKGAGVGGVILQGPTSAGGFTWWKVNFDYEAIVDGWVAESLMASSPLQCSLVI